MANLRLRLSDEQHAELTQAARENMRSLQAEIIYRLFRSDLSEAGRTLGRAGGKAGYEAGIGLQRGKTGPGGATEKKVKVRAVDTETGEDVSADYVTGPAVELPSVTSQAAADKMTELVKAKPRLYACKHYVPPSKKCSICDG